MEELVDFDINFEIAKNLQIPTIELVNAKDMETLQELEEHIDYLIKQSERERVQLLGIFVNRFQPKLLNEMGELKRNVPIFTIPEIGELTELQFWILYFRRRLSALRKHSYMLDRTVHPNKSPP